MQTLVSNPSLRATLGMQARRHCLDHFSKDHVVHQILNYYRFVLAVGAAGASVHNTAATIRSRRVEASRPS
jgi:hypothetical protein